MYIFIYIYLYLYITSYFIHTYVHIHRYIYKGCSNLTEVRRTDEHNIYVTIKTMCPPSYHHNGFVANHELVPKLKQKFFKTMKSIHNCAKIFLLKSEGIPILESIH